MRADEYVRHDATALAGLVARGEVSAGELLDTAVAITRAQDGTLNAVTHDHEDLARAQIADGLPDGPFRGVPFLLKDLGVGLKGTVTTFGAALFKDAVAPADTTLVSRHKQAGFVIYGKTNTPEYGAAPATEPRLFGPTRNPWNLSHTPGGSSGGASAAVAAGYVPAAHASDGGGSIRIPASCAGLFGMKPTRARTPVGPDRSEGWAGLSINHVVSRSVRDSAAILDATEGPETGDFYACPPKVRPYTDDVTRDPGRLRIAFYTKPPRGQRLDPEVRAATEAAAKLCERLGHAVEEAVPPVDWEAVADAQAKIVGASTLRASLDRAAQLGRALREDDLEPINWLMAEAGRGTDAATYIAALQTVHRAGRVAGRFMEDYDVLLTPTLACLPPAIGKLSLSNPNLNEYLETLFEVIAFTPLANQTGQPAMSVPLAWSTNGLPIGIMFAGRFGDEATLFSLAGQLERAQPWFDRRPNLRA